MNLVLIETSGNQAYIFATNKLRENVGASELIYRVGIRYVFDAIDAVGGLLPADPRVATSYPAIDGQNPVEILVAASGKALLLVRDAALGRQIVREVTLRALKEAPGLEVRGVVSRDFDFDKQPLHPLIGEVHREYEKVRSRLPGPATRFLRLPIAADCASSGLPAARLPAGGDDIPADDRGEYAAPVLAKVRARNGWHKRLQNILERQQAFNRRLPDATTTLEKLGCDWLAIVHADGNGLGQVFLQFDKCAETKDNRDYITKLRAFSLGLDDCTEKAFCKALSVLRPKSGVLPIVPLVLGGDDLTVVCDGRQALQFTKKFIDYFEEETRDPKGIHAILKKGATICAGVAIVKPHFPFFAGYQLAEELLQSAKKIAKKNPKYPLSAIDYHILYDASGPDLKRIRSELTVDDGKTLLVGRPYVATANEGPTHRRWSDLVCRVAVVRARDEDDRRRLPNSMLHELREGLFLGHAAADARLKLVLERYRREGLERLLGDKDSLFWKENGEHRRTALLDALDAAEFWEGQP